MEAVFGDGGVGQGGVMCLSGNVVAYFGCDSFLPLALPVLLVDYEWSTREFSFDCYSHTRVRILAFRDQCL